MPRYVGGNDELAERQKALTLINGMRVFPSWAVTASLPRAVGSLAEWQDSFNLNGNEGSSLHVLAIPGGGRAW